MRRRVLRDRRVIVTGASSGIGRELALALARRRSRLLLAARREPLLRAVAEECRQLGAAVEYAAGDVADEGFRNALVRVASDRWSGLDVVVNNAGVSAHGPFAGSDEATLRRVMEVNFFAAVELTRQALPLLLEGQDPAIACVASILGHRGIPLNSEYCASKFALRGFCEALRAELAPHGVDVLVVSPGTTETEFFDHLIARRSELPWANSKGISAAAVAELAVRALERRRREIFPNWRGRALVMANRLFPGAVDRVMAKLSASGDSD